MYHFKHFDKTVCWCSYHYLVVKYYRTLLIVPSSSIVIMVVYLNYDNYLYIYIYFGVYFFYFYFKTVYYCLHPFPSRPTNRLFKGC